MRKHLLNVLALAAVLGLAQGGRAAAEQGKGPCAADAAKFCKDVKPGGGRIAACLKEHEKELSQACADRRAKAAGRFAMGGANACRREYGRGFGAGFRSGFKMSGAMRAGRGGRNACAADTKKFCEGVKPGEGRVRDCLIKNLDKLSEGCKARAEKAKEKLEGKGGKV